MIRRAQAEALLKLAEALEECERNGVELICKRGSHLGISDARGVIAYTDNPRAVNFRLLIAELYPKSEAAE